MLVLESGELVVDFVSAVLLTVAIGSDKFKEWILSSWEAEARTRETDALIVYRYTWKQEAINNTILIILRLHLS